MAKNIGEYVARCDACGIEMSKTFEGTNDEGRIVEDVVADITSWLRRHHWRPTDDGGDLCHVCAEHRIQRRAARIRAAVCNAEAAARASEFVGVDDGKEASDG